MHGFYMRKYNECKNKKTIDFMFAGYGLLTRPTHCIQKHFIIPTGFKNEKKKEQL